MLLTESYYCIYKIKIKKLYIDDKIKGKNDLMDAHHANMRITCFPFSFARWTTATTKPCLTTYRITKELSELIDSKPRSDRINKFGEKKLCLDLKTKR